MTKIILILSGKGGCGKSSCTSLLAHELSAKAKVGILDVDLCGPSQSRMMGLNDCKIQMTENGWEPAMKGNISVMSLAFMMASDDTPVIWRGPKKNAMIMQFISQTNWPELDFLLIDTPPGTSDEHLTIVEYLQENPLKNNVTTSLNALIITTPQKVACNDVKKELMFCHRVGLSVIGVIENMSGYTCPHCNTCSHIFSKKSYVEDMCTQFNTRIIGKLPIMPNIAKSLDNGDSMTLDPKYFAPVLDAII
eukprot:NODE_626_length_5881_cov_0.289519.p3 type:complete len:250 gc:universal NODE_626_length_5881_cov_0.289519:4958-5707(+)